MNNKVLLLGCGNLGSLLVSSWKNNNFEITVLEKNKNSVKLLKKKFKRYVFETSLDNIIVSEYSIIILCVKPIHSIPLIRRISKLINKKQIFISLVAGLETERVKELLIKDVNIFRVMPNILASVMSSSTALFCREESKNKRKIVKKLFLPLGEITWIKDEKQFDFFTSMFGGGPAYIFYFIKTLMTITRKSGFESKLASHLVLSLLHGASKFLGKNYEDIDSHISKVASKGGTTEEVLNYFSSNDRLYNLVSSAIIKGSKKSKTLRKQLSKV